MGQFPARSDPTSPTQDLVVAKLVLKLDPPPGLFVDKPIRHDVARRPSRSATAPQAAADDNGAPTVEICVRRAQHGAIESVPMPSTWTLLNRRPSSCLWSRMQRHSLDGAAHYEKESMKKLDLARYRTPKQLVTHGSLIRLTGRRRGETGRSNNSEPGPTDTTNRRSQRQVADTLWMTWRCNALGDDTGK